MPFRDKKLPESMLPKFNKNTGRMAISTVTLAELIFGAEKNGKRIGDNDLHIAGHARSKGLQFKSSQVTLINTNIHHNSIQLDLMDFRQGQKKEANRL
nr:hypothetical protein [Photorhabdus cinerea]